MEKKWLGLGGTENLGKKVAVSVLKKVIVGRRLASRSDDEFNAQNPCKGGRREITTSVCPLASTCMSWHTCTHTYIHTTYIYTPHTYTH